ncbi:MAG: NAD(+)/NADH kinase [Deltaproteobacteria bacterium]|nr:NAD(+)/NADH kinase [Deltaproteobacteria bacterium]
MKKTPTINRILIVYKKSSYEEHVLDEKDANYLRLLKEKSIVLQKSKNIHEIHIDTLETIQGYLRQLKIPFDVRLRYELKPTSDYDLVITVGGDGTFLETSHYVTEGLLMGVNSVPKESVGYYCHATTDTFLEKIYLYLKGKAKIQELHRLQMTIDGLQKGPLALNDILYANQNPAGTTRYLLKIGHQKEEQKSSGLWISPAPGSTAATQSAGGKRLPLGSKNIQFVTREPYAPIGKQYKLLHGIFSPKQKVEITSLMDDAAVFIDGPHEIFPVKRGTKVVVQHTPHPIRAIW